VRVWNAGDGALIHALEGHRGAVEAVAWSGDGVRLISGSRDGSARVWDAERGAALGEPVTIGQVVHGVSLSVDGRWAAAGGDGATPQVWRLDGRRHLLALEGPTSVVTAVSLTGDGSRLVTAGVDATVRIWDARSGKLLGSRHGHRGPVRRNGMAVAAADTIVATASDDRSVRFWDVRAPVMTTAQLRAFVGARVPWCLDADDQPRRVQPGSHAGGTCDQRR
jgi:WD40 repeat protein